MNYNLLLERVKKTLGRYINTTPSTGKVQIDPDDFYGAGEGGNWSKFLDDALQRKASDKQKYMDYDLMDDEIPEISTALDVMSDFVVFPDSVNHTSTFKVKSRKYQKEIDEIDTITKFQTIAHSMVREACKYGDNIEELIPNVNKTNIVTFKNVPIDSVVVNIENGVKQKDPAITQFDSSNKEIARLSEEECIHFSLPTSRKRYSLTGKGISRVEKARLIYRQLRLSEEGMIIARLSKANSNYGIIVDVGDLTGEDALNYIDKYRKRVSRRKYVDPQSGRLSYKFNPLSVLEDILVPTRQGSGGNIIPLNQNQSRGTIDDINYLQNKMIYATGVPKLLIGKEEDVNSKATSETQYVAFLRMIRNIQTWIEPEILGFYIKALSFMGIKDADDLFLEWPLFGTIDEERKWRIMQIKTVIAQVMGRDLMLVDDEWLYDNIFNIPEEEKEELKTRMDAEEEENKAEIDSMFDDAEDMTDDEDAEAEFASPDDVKKMKDKEKTKKKPMTPKAKEKEQKRYMEKLKAILPKEAMDDVNAVISNPILQKYVYEYIHLSNTKAGAVD